MKEARKKTVKPLLWLGVISITMLFAGFTSAYTARADNGSWQIISLPSAFYLSTAIIITSSITLFAAFQMAKKDNQKGIVIGLIATFLLGILFTYTQFQGWAELKAADIVLAGKFSNAAGSFVYLLTGIHLLHLAGGLISLLVAIFNAVKGKYNSQNTLGLELCSIYWHFLDILWIYLFLFLYYIR